MLRQTIIFLALVTVTVKSFPDGAPADTCVKKRANQPNHGAARSQSLESLPYQVVASSDNYKPGQQILVQIYGHVFRGFFIQARDAQTNEWIGAWEQSPNTKTIPECSAITHGDPKDKTGATLIWNAPQNKQGQVYFTGTVVKDYGAFWAELVAGVLIHTKDMHFFRNHRKC